MKQLKHALASFALISLTAFAGSAIADTVKRFNGERCPAGYRHVTYQEATAQRNAHCGQLAQWDIARLAGGASMDGRGYSCKTRPSDGRPLGHSLCKKRGNNTVGSAQTRSTSINQAAYVNGTQQYRYGHNSIPNMKVTGAPADTDFSRYAMLHDRGTYRIYFFKRGSRNTLYQFGFNRASSRYEYGYNSIKTLRIIGMPRDASHQSFAMLHDGRDYRLYMRSKSNRNKIYQAAYKPGTNQYVYGFRSIKSMNLIGSPADITHNRRWGMLHDGKDYRLYIGRRGRPNQFYQYAFDRSASAYRHGLRSIPLLKVNGMPGTSRKNAFAMLHDGSAYRFYHKTR